MIARYRREHPRVPGAVVPAWILPEPSCQLLSDIGGILPAGSAAFEFGSGRSTHALRRVFAAVTSVEDSQEWLDRTESVGNAIARRESDITAVVALQRCWLRLRPIESFDLRSRPDIVARLGQANLILVDSPPNPAKREHALYLALRHAPAGAIIVLDDLEVRATDRFAERFASQNKRLFRFWNIDIDHGLAIFFKRHSGRVRARPGLIEFVGTWLRA